MMWFWFAAAMKERIAAGEQGNFAMQGLLTLSNCATSLAPCVPASPCRAIHLIFKENS